jgi:hypothetical protein
MLLLHDVCVLLILCAWGFVGIRVTQKLTKRLPDFGSRVCQYLIVVVPIILWMRSLGT